MLPNITIELRHLGNDTYESRILGLQNQEIIRSNFLFREDDAFLVCGTGYLEEDRRREDKHITPGFIQRIGQHFYELITNKKDTFKEYLRLNNDLREGYTLTIALDIKMVREKPAFTGIDNKGDPRIERLIEIVRKRAIA